MTQISVILPVRNEEKALKLCIEAIKNALDKTTYSYEVIVSDSSSDKSPLIAIKEGAILVKHDKVGYGNAYLEGVSKAKGKYLFFADADMTYDFSEILRFISALEKGAQFVIGDRFGKKMQKGAMPFSHKYIGNPGLSAAFNFFFGSSIRDVHCGMRAMRKEDFDNLNLHTTGMEFASEMIVKAVKQKYSFTQIPISYKRRVGDSKLNTWHDGWRHLRFMLLYCPEWLFIWPGIFLTGISSVLFFLNYTGNLSVFGSTLAYHPLLIWSAGAIVGFQMILFGLFAKTYTYTLQEYDSPFMKGFFSLFTLEKGIGAGLVLATIAGVLVIPDVLYWVVSGQPSLDKIKEFILALSIGILGIQLLFSSFMISALGVKIK